MSLLPKQQNSIKMIKNIFKVLLLVIIITSCQTKLNKDSYTDNNTLKVDSLVIGAKHVLVSKIMDEGRPIIISLPDNYANSEANYPVLYLTDGLQNIWHTMGSVEVLTRTGSIPPMIIVGIESTDRGRDFTPTVNENNPGSGNGPEFLDFIENELIPYIDSNYRTHPFRVLEGHSLGGLFTATALMERPGLFNAHIIMSPSFWWNNEEIIGKAEVFFKSHQNLENALFFGIGMRESGTKWGMRKELQNFIDVLEANKPVKLRFEHKEFENEGHMSSPLLSTYYGLKSIFSDMTLPKEVEDNYNNETFLNHEKMIMEKYGKEAKQSAENYMILGFQLINEENLLGAITVFKRGVQAYSYDIHLRGFLASTYEKNKNKTKAIETYKKAIEVSKKYKFAREEEFQAHIDRLKSE